MIRFTVRLLVTSLRWVPPTLLWLTWTAILLTAAGPALSFAVSLVPPLLIWAIWMQVAVGTIDDDPHHDLVAAAAGSVGRLHLWRMAAVAALGLAPVAATMPLVVLLERGGQGLLTVAAAAAAVQLSAVAAGVVIGSFLHRPTLVNRAASTILAVVGVVAVLLTPPVQAALRAVDGGHPAASVGLLASVAAVAACATALSVLAAQRRRL